MSVISKQIAALFQGVSQQTPALRLPSQADAQENMFSSPVDGIHKRANTHHVKKLYNTALTKPYVHAINRDRREKYLVVMADGDLKVFDLEGNERTVTFPNGKDYLTSDAPRDEFKVQTVADYTFIVNRNVQPAAAVTPYLSTDQVSLTLNFGDGTTGTPVVQPIFPGATFAWQYKKGFVSGGNPEGWATAGGFTNYTDAMDAWEADVLASSGTITPYTRKAFIEEDGINPSYDNNSTLSSPDFGLGIAITQNPDEPALSIVIPASIHGGASFDPELRIYYKRSNSYVDPNNAITVIRDDAGWPDTPYRVPGESYAEHVMPVFDGALFVQVNGTLYSITQQPSWTAEQYANYFKTQIEADFPTLTITNTTGWQLFIEAPAGERVFVSAWDTNHRGYVQCIYSSLPIQEAIFIVIREGVADQTYAVSINGNIYDYTTGPVASPATWKVDTIATQLAADINAGGLFSAAVYGNFIKVISPTNTPMTFASHDTWNDQAMYAMKNRIQAFEDLPVKFIPGHPIEVVGTAGQSGYYVHYTLKGAKAPKAYGIDRQVQLVRPFQTINPPGNTWNAVEGEETGGYEECAKPGAPDTLIPYSMPHVLVSNADGTFTFKEVDWFKRPCGDEDSVPTPSIVGKTIQDIFFHRNRLGFMTSETVVMSRPQEFFNFWPQFASVAKDDDPIDAQVNHTRVATLRHSAVFNNQLLLFSDNTQFVVTGQPVLSPLSYAIQPSTEFEVSYKCKPVTLGETVVFLAERGKYTSAWEYYVETNAVANTAQELTAHIPKYVPKDVWKLAPGVALDTLVGLTDAEPNTLYVYKWLWGNEGKLQNSWSKWTFSGTILNADYMDTQLVFLMQYADGVYLETADMEHGVIDDEVGFRVYLDRRVALTGTYDSGTNKTTFDMPYPTTGGVYAVRQDNGQAIDTTIVDVDTFTVNGNRPELWVGKAFTMLYRFSAVYPRAQDNQPILGAALVLRKWSVSYENTAEFRIEVTPEKRQTYVNPFYPQSIGINAMLGTVQLDTGVFTVPVGGDGATTRIDVVADTHLPCFLQSAVWEGNFVLRTRRT